MTGIFKVFGKGILYFFLFPFILAGIAIAGVAGIGIFLFMFFKMVIIFFSGRTIGGDLEEDIEAKAILGEIKLEEEEQKDENPLSLYPSDSPVYGSGYSSPLFEEKKVEKEPELEFEEEKEDDNNDY